MKEVENTWLALVLSGFMELVERLGLSGSMRSRAAHRPSGRGQPST